MTLILGPTTMPGGRIAISVGRTAVTTSALNVDTGLTTVLGVKPSIKSSTAPLTGVAFVTCEHDNDGLIDIYCWTAINTPALLPATISWVALGVM